MTYLFIGLAAIAFVVVGVITAKFLYRVVPINEAHIRVMMSKTRVFSARTNNSAYWFIPIITKLHKLPLSNLAIPVNDVKLNDRDMAKFVTDIMCFVNIDKLELAVERLTLTDVSSELGFSLDALQNDLKAILESIGRTVATKQTIIDIYMDREKLDTAITKEVESVFPKWGLKLVDLELKDIKDAPDSSIIHDIERKVAAEKERDAQIKEAEMNKEAKIKEASASEEFRKREVARDREVGMAEQTAVLEIAKKKAEANEQEVEAYRKLEVGKADVARSVTQKKAEAERIKLTEEAEGKAQEILKEGQAEADIVSAKGDAEAHVVKAVKLADAEGTLKLAAALKEFNDVAINVKVLDILKDVQIAKFQEMGKAMSSAEIKWILQGEQSGNLFGMDFNASTGANLEQFLEESNLGDVDVPKLTDLVKKATKGFTAQEKGNGGLD